MQVLAFPGSNLQDSKEAHREKSLAHSLFHFSPSFSVVICMENLSQAMRAPVRFTP